MTDRSGYADWRSLELVIKDAAKQAARDAGPGISAATIDAQIRQARFGAGELAGTGSARRWLPVPECLG